MMSIRLESIGAIQSSEIELEGITVVAGENGTGKSTISKILFALVKADMIALAKTRTTAYTHEELFRQVFNQQIFYVFKDQISPSGLIEVEYGDLLYRLVIKNHKLVEYEVPPLGVNRRFRDVIYIQTPLIWDLMETFQSISNYKTESDLLDIVTTRIDYPFVLWELYLRLSSRRDKEEHPLGKALQIEEIIGGEFQKQQDGRFRFKTEEEAFELHNVASGIKQFGVLQTLANNQQFSRRTLLAYDEPEVHLHPKWEIRMAEVLVLLAKEGLPCLINTHSPYILEALKLYAEREKIQHTVRFYLATDGKVVKQEGLESIFEKLAMPMRDLKELKWNLTRES